MIAARESKHAEATSPDPVSDSQGALAPLDTPAATPGAIGYLVKVFPRLSETFILNEVLELRRLGVPLKLYSLQPAPAGPAHVEAASLLPDLVCLPRFNRTGARPMLSAHVSLFRKNPRRYLATLFIAASRLRRSAWRRFAQAGVLAARLAGDDVVHVHAGFAHAPATVAWFVRRLTGVPFSFTAHAKDLYLSEPKSIRRKCEAARFIITCTKTNAEHLRSIAGESVEWKLHVVYHGADLRRFAETGESGAEAAPPDDGAEGRTSKNASRLLAVGRLVPKKGFEYLLEAVAALAARRMEVRLDLVGGGALREALESRARALGIDSRVTFHGALPQDEIVPLYRAADVVVLPSIPLENGDRDGIPNVLVEAMAMGLAVVSTTAGGIPELIDDGTTGFLVPPRDASALADAIGKLVRDARLRRRLGGAAAAEVRARFDLSRNSEAVASLLESARHTRSVLYLTSDFGIPVYGAKGASVHVRELCDALANEAVGVTVLTPRDEAFPGNSTRAEVIGVPVDPAAGRLCAAIERTGRGSARARRLSAEVRRILYNRPLYRAALRQARLNPPDAIYERYSLCATAGGRLARALGVPHLLEVNAPLSDEEEAYRGLVLKRLTRTLERRILRGADRVFIVSAGLRRFARALGVRDERVEVLPNGVDLERFHPGRDGSSVRRALGWDESFVVGFAGTLKAWHGTEILVDAFARLHAARPRARLLLVGHGPMRKSLEKRLARAGLSGVAHFTGEVTHEAVADHLAAADVLVAPYTPSERFYFSPLKLYEYMALGKPVVASDIGQLAEVLDPGANALLVPPGDVEALEAALERLERDPALAHRLAGEAARTARENHSWARNAHRIMSSALRLRSSRWNRPGERAREPRKAPVRVGYCLKMFPRFSETFVLNEILELERQGVDIQVFSMKTPGGEPLQAGARRVRAEVTYLPLPRLRNVGVFLPPHARLFLRSPRRYVGALRFAFGRGTREALEKFALAGLVAVQARRDGVQHLHAHFASGPARLAKFASLLSGIPYSFTAHAKDLYWNGNAVRCTHKLKRRVRFARFVVTISEHNRTFIESRGFHVKEGKIRTVYNGVDLGRLEQRDGPSARARCGEPPLLLAVGRLIPKKGFDDLVRAAAVLRARGRRCRVEIAGEGPERDALSALAASLGIADDVHLAGSVPLERLVTDQYSRAAALVIPAVIAEDGDRDGIPTVILEAMALGVPVVSTPVSGIPEAVEDGETGFLVPPRDPERLADAIERLLDDPGLASRLAAGGRRLVEERFDLQKSAGALREMFRKSARLGETTACVS